MKNSFLTILCLFLLSVASCRFIEAETSTTATTNLAFEKVFQKDGLKEVERAVFSSDGKYFLVSDNSSCVVLWESPFLEPSRNLPIENYDSDSAMKFISGDRNIFLASTGGLVQIWDSKLKIKEFEFKFPCNTKHVSITEDGRFIAASGYLYDRKKKSLVGSEVAHDSYSAVHFGGKSLLVTSGYHDRSIVVRNIFSGDFDRRRLPHPIPEANISPDEKYVVATTYKGRGYFWRWPEKDPKVISISREKEFHYFTFAPNSKWFVFCGADAMTIFAGESAEQLAHMEFEPALRSVAVVSNNLIVMGDVKGFVHIYDVSARKIIASHKVLENEVEFLRLIPEKELLWAATSSYLGGNVDDRGEVALYRVKGLAPFIEPQIAQE
jgi:WD40 repeat protein